MTELKIFNQFFLVILLFFCSNFSNVNAQSSEFPENIVVWERDFEKLTSIYDGFINFGSYTKVRITAPDLYLDVLCVTSDKIVRISSKDTVQLIGFCSDEDSLIRSFRYLMSEKNEIIYLDNYYIGPNIFGDAYLKNAFHQLPLEDWTGDVFYDYNEGDNEQLVVEFRNTPYGNAKMTFSPTTKEPIIEIFE